MQTRLLFRLLAALAILSTSILGTAATALADTETIDGATATLIAKAAAEGPLPVIVTLTSVAAQDGVIEELAELDATVTVQYDLFPLLAATAGPDAITALAHADEVVSVREDIPQPPALDTTLPIINGDDVQNLGWDGGGQTVAILDTGIDNDHPFFGTNGARIVAEACFSNSGGGGGGLTLCPDGSNAQTGAGAADATVANCVDSGANICDHGTHVAGIAAGSAAGATGAPGNGVAPGANVIAIQVFTRFNTDADCGTGNSPCVLATVADQILGLQEVLTLSATNTIAAANMSLGGGMNATACDGDTRKAPIDALLAAGIPTVVSSGNNSFINAVGAPGCISTAVTVGRTNDDDTVGPTGNRGPLLDIMAPGTSVDSSIVDDVFGFKGGTSMSAPHVAGAFAILREAYPTATVATLLGYMTSTGVPISYDTDGMPGNDQTTPRLNLLAALQAGNDAPTLTVTHPLVTVNEGATATNNGTFSDPTSDPVTLSASVGTVSDTGGGTWSWSFGTNDGPDQDQTVTITATDNKSESGTITFDLDVLNVDPTVAIAAGQVTAILEGDTVTVNATFSDPGWADTYSAAIDWGTGDSSPGTLAVTTDGPPVDAGTVTGSFQYGDDGVFIVTVSVTDDDGGTGSASFPLTVGNVNPTATIDETGTVLVNGTPTFIAQAGEPIDFTGDSTDPGSDDLTLSWNWDDGAPAPDVSTAYLVDPPGTDPDPSPSVQPRNVSDTQTHAFADACFYQITFSALDDDGGSASDSATVIIGGNSDKLRGAGYWQHQYKGNGKIDFTTAERLCYLEIVGYMSTVFNEARSATTIAQAHDVIWVAGNKGSMTQLLDRQLMTMGRLNFANGAHHLTDLVDTNGDGIVDTTFGTVIATAEAVRLNPASTRAQLELQKNILERING